MNTNLVNIDGHNFPWTWRYFLPEDWRFTKLPQERCASCLDCPKIQTDAYLPNTKCCTYTPRIPNFILGQIATEQPNFFEQLLSSDLLTPEGLQASPLQLQHSLIQYDGQRFGKSKETVCPMLDEKAGLCRIHDKRNAVCSTYFCINDQGSHGLEFWNYLRDYIGQMETALCQWAMKSCGIDLDEYFSRYNELAGDFDECSNPASKGWSQMALKKLWAKHYTKQKEFYIQTFNVFCRHINDLQEIAERTEIKEPLEFDEKIVSWLDPSSRNIYLSEVPSRGGKAIAPSQILYETNATLKNIWNIEFGQHYQHCDDIIISTIPSGDPMMAFYERSGLKFQVEAKSLEKRKRLPLTQGQRDLLEQFKKPKTITNEILYDDTSEFNVHSFLQECIYYKLIVPV